MADPLALRSFSGGWSDPSDPSDNRGEKVRKKAHGVFHQCADKLSVVRFQRSIAQVAERRIFLQFFQQPFSPGSLFGRKTIRDFYRSGRHPRRFGHVAAGRTAFRGNSSVNPGNHFFPFFCLMNIYHLGDLLRQHIQYTVCFVFFQALQVKSITEENP